MVACLKLQLAGSSDKGSEAVTSDTLRAFGGRPTWQVTWRFDEEAAVLKSREREKKKQHTKQQMRSGGWLCLWQCCDVVWDRAGSNAWTGCCWYDVIWCQEDLWGWVGDVSWLDQSPPLFSLYSFSLSLFSHTHAHKHPQSVRSSSLCQSYLSYHAATHYHSFLNSFLSIQYSPFSHFLPDSCFISLSPVSCESVTQYRVTGMGAAPDHPPMDR